MNDNPPVYGQDNKIIYRASSLGGCLTMLAAARQGFERTPPGKQIAKVYEAGNEAEEQFFDRYPQLALNRQLPVYVEITKRIVVVAHVDALTPSGMVEVKSQSDREWQEWRWEWWTENRLWKKYAWQVSVEMLGSEKQGLVYRVNRGTGEVRFDEAITRPFHTLEEIRERVLEVEALALDDIDQCKTPDFFCDYPYLHPQLEPVEDDEMEELVEKYLEVGQRAKRAQGEQGEIREKILERMSGTNYPDKILLMSGRTVGRSVVEVKEHMVRGSVQTRLNVGEAK